MRCVLKYYAADFRSKFGRLQLGECGILCDKIDE